MLSWVINNISNDYKYLHIIYTHDLCYIMCIKYRIHFIYKKELSKNYIWYI